MSYAFNVYCWCRKNTTEGENRNMKYLFFDVECGLNNATSIIVVLDEKEKKLQSRSYLTVLTFKEFIK